MGNPSLGCLFYSINNLIKRQLDCRYSMEEALCLYRSKFHLLNLHLLHINKMTMLQFLPLNIGNPGQHSWAQLFVNTKQQPLLGHSRFLLIQKDQNSLPCLQSHHKGEQLHLVSNQQPAPSSPKPAEAGLHSLKLLPIVFYCRHCHLMLNMV